MNSADDLCMRPRAGSDGDLWTHSVLSLMQAAYLGLSRVFSHVLFCGLSV